MRPHPLTLLLMLAAAAGFVFAAFSTYDFVAHLDRQVHGVHCSFLPGLTASESTGCQVTLMSPYSSVLRGSIWGGVPISLPAMSVFAFLAFWGAWLALRERERDPRATGFALLATTLPVVASAVMGYIALGELDAACKLCIGIYVSSTLAFVAALGLFMRARAHRLTQEGGGEPLAPPVLIASFVLGIAFVAVPVASYVGAAPDFSRYVGSCGELEHPWDPQNLLVPLGSQSAKLEMIEVLDPLCPSCRGFEERFAELDAASEVSRRALMFPLDNACNWMVDEAVHPGACKVSEAVLCAGSDAQKVLDWAFAEQEAIVSAAKDDANAAEQMVKRAFPELASCVGRPATAAKLNLALRWAVRNRLHILTPQVYVNGLRLCDADTDLGLDYALPRLIERARSMPERAAPPQEPRPRVAPLARGPAPSLRGTEGEAKPVVPPVPQVPAPQPAADSEGALPEPERALEDSTRQPPPAPDEPETEALDTPAPADPSAQEAP